MDRKKTSNKQCEPKCPGFGSKCSNPQVNQPRVRCWRLVHRSEHTFTTRHGSISGSFPFRLISSQQPPSPAQHPSAGFTTTGAAKIGSQKRIPVREGERGGTGDKWRAADGFAGGCRPLDDRCRHLCQLRPSGAMIYRHP